MLQQTRVETVIPFYERFLERLPSVKDLARADEDEVLSLWSGLGYYRRARSLGAAARAIVGRGGIFPDEREALLELPGVGPYTAAALLSIAFDRPEPLVDGNVARLFARFFGIEEKIDSQAGKRKLWELARRLVPPGPERGCVSPRNFNQGVMELGALLCTPRVPRCSICPLRAACAARAEGREQDLPRAAPRRELSEVKLEVLIVRRGGRVLFVRRPSSGRMERMWELPTRELTGSGMVEGNLWPVEFAVPLRPAQEIGFVRHAITHHRIRVAIRRGRLSSKARVVSARLRWVRPAEIDRLAVTGLSRKVLGHVTDARRQG